MPLTTWEWVHKYEAADIERWHDDSEGWMQMALRESSGIGPVPPRRSSPSAYDRPPFGFAAAAIAIELIYRVLLIGERARFEDHQPISELHALLGERREPVEAAIRASGRERPEDLLRMLEDRLSRLPRGGARRQRSEELLRVQRIARLHGRLIDLADLRKLLREFRFAERQVRIAVDLKKQPTPGFQAMATRWLVLNGDPAECTVYEAREPDAMIEDALRGWWQLPSGTPYPSHHYVYLLNESEFRRGRDYWSELAEEPSP